MFWQTLEGCTRGCAALLAPASDSDHALAGAVATGDWNTVRTRLSGIHLANARRQLAEAMAAAFPERTRASVWRSLDHTDVVDRTLGGHLLVHPDVDHEGALVVIRSRGGAQILKALTHDALVDVVGLRFELQDDNSSATAIALLSDLLESGRFSSLRRLQMHAAGSSPADFFDALPKSLEELAPLGVRLGGDALAKLSALPNLRALTLMHRKVDYTQLAKLQNLETLQLNNTGPIDAKGIAALAGLPNLRRLQLTSAGAKAVIKAISGTQLVDLDLSDNNIDDKTGAALGKMTTLRRLVLGKNDIGAATAKAIASLPLLELDVQNNRNLGDNIAALGACRSLVSLRDALSGGGRKGAEGISALESLRFLLTSPHAGLELLVRLPRLLALRAQRLPDDSVIEAIGASQSLIEANLDFGETLDVRAMESIAAAQTIRAVSVSHAPIGDAGLAHLATLRHLEHLQLRANGITPGAARHFARHESLSTFWTGENAFGDDDAEALATAPCISWLSVGNATLTTRGMTALACNGSLRQLGLEMSSIDDDAGAALGKAKHLRSVILADSGLSAETVDVLRAALPHTLVRA